MLGGLDYHPLAKRTFPALLAGSFPRLATDRAGDQVNVFDFMSAAEIADVKTNTGSINVAARIAAAYAASPHVFFPPGTYFLGNLAANAVAVTLNGAGGKLSLLTGGGIVKFTCNTTDNTLTECFRIQNAVGVRIGDVHFEDAGYDGAITFKGAVGFNINALTVAVSNVRIGAIYAKNMVGPIIVTPYAATRVSGLQIDLIVTDTCTYGFNCQNNGDGVQIGLIYAVNTKRSYFVYGCKRHDVSIYHVDGAAMATTTGNILISRYVAGYDTEHIRIKFYGNNSTNNTGPIVNLSHFGTDVGYIRDVELDLDSTSSTAIRVIQAINYTDDTGAVENVGASLRVIDRLFVKGRIDAPTAPDYVHIRYQPSTPGLLLLDPSIPQSKLSSAALTYFKQGDVTTFVPSWASSIGPAPAIGNGTLTGRYTRKGNEITASIHFSAGNTTTFGGAGGVYTFGLPKAGLSPQVQTGTFRFRDDSTGAIYTGTCQVVNGDAFVYCLLDNPAGSTFVAQNVPVAWANLDQLDITITFHCGPA